MKKTSHQNRLYNLYLQTQYIGNCKLKTDQVLKVNNLEYTSYPKTILVCTLKKITKYWTVYEYVLKKLSTQIRRKCLLAKQPEFKKINTILLKRKSCQST